MTISVRGPAFVYAGEDATFDVTIDVEEQSSDVYLTWQGAGSSGALGGLCCEGSAKSPAVSGTATVIGNGIGFVRLNVEGPRAVVQLVLRLYDEQPRDGIIVSGYLPGTNVAQYETINPWKSIVSTGRLPETGGRPPESTNAGSMIGAGLAMLLVSAACVAWATKSRRGEAIW